MAKKILFESFKYRLLITAAKSSFSTQPDWDAFIKSLKITYDKGTALVSWQYKQPGNLTVSLSEPQFYFRGDSQSGINKQQAAGLLGVEDPVRIKNDLYFKTLVQQLAALAGYRSDCTQNTYELRNQVERDFHDAWAESEDVEKIDVLLSNQVCTAPEMRWITKQLGDIKGKRLLDVGCGLGEASVYFAMLGADVTSTDLSQGMLDATSRLAKANGVIIKQHIASADDIQLGPEERFDIIYAGNLLHHVDIEQTIMRIKPHLADNGMFVTWDPLDYNPAINAYRAIATDVRTPDEHPLKWGDIKLFHKHFEKVETNYFWFTTLIIFIIMSLIQRRNPNKERFWKVILQEGDKWAWLYNPLEKVDRFLLAIFPPLRLLCWNVVVISKISDAS